MKKLLFVFAVLIFAFPLFAKTQNLVFNKSYNCSQIESLEILLTYENLKITQIYGDEITVEISSNNNKQVPSVLLDQDDLSDKGNLIIKSAVTRTKPGNKCSVYLYIPQEFIADSIIISLVSGNLQADFLRSENSLAINNVSGRTDIAGLSTDFLNLSSISGNIKTQKLSVSYFYISNISGNTFIELDKPMLAKSMLSSITGKIQVYYKKNESPFTDDSPEFIISTISGKIEKVAY